MVPVGVRTVESAETLHGILDIGLRTGLPAKRAVFGRTGITADILVCEHARCREGIVVPVGDGGRIVDSAKASAAGPSRLRRNRIQSQILVAGGNGNQVAPHSLEIITLCAVIALCPADCMARHKHVIVLRAVPGYRIRNGAFCDRDVSRWRQTVLSVTQIDLKLLACSRRGQLELEVLFNKVLCLSCGQRCRKDNLIKLMVRQDIRNGTVTLTGSGRPGFRQGINSAVIDFEVDGANAAADGILDCHFF